MSVCLSSLSCLYLFVFLSVFLVKFFAYLYFAVLTIHLASDASVNLFISSGATHEDAVLTIRQAGDASVNLFISSGATHEDAVLTIRQAGDDIVFLVCDGFDPALVEGLPAEGAFIEEENSQVRKGCCCHC